MANTRDPLDKDPSFHENEPRFSRSLGTPKEDMSGAAGLRGVVEKIRDVSWFQKSPNLVKGALAAALLVLLALIVGWQLGWFESGARGPTPSVAAQPTLPPGPTTPQPPASPGMLGTPSGPGMPAMPPGPGLPGMPPGSMGRQPYPLGPNLPGAPNPAELEKDQKPPLPDDVATWKKEDYYRARQETDPKLLEAVVYLGEKFPGSDHAARGLTELLKPRIEEPPPAESEPAPPQMPGSTPPGMMPPRAGPHRQNMGPYPPVAGHYNPNVRQHNQGGNKKLIETIVDVLAGNGSESAQHTLEAILTGELTTEDDHTAVEAVLSALVSHPSDENDALLFRVLTAPEALRPAKREGPWPAGALWAKTLEIVRPAGSGKLRTRLAEFVAERFVRLDPKHPICEFLLTPDPLNCGAQVAFYRKNGSTRNFRTALEQQLTAYGSMAMVRLLGVSEKIQAEGMGLGGMPGVMRGAGPIRTGMNRSLDLQSGMPGMPGMGYNMGQNQPARATKVDHVPRLACHLWSEEFRALLEPQLNNLRSLERQSQLVLLGCVIPHDSTRAALAKALRKHWDDGTTALEAAGLVDRVVTDPALLVLVKMLPRKGSLSQTQSPMGGLPRSTRTGRDGHSNGTGKIAEAVQKKQQSQQDWLNVSFKLTSDWCKRFHTAALNQGKTDSVMGAMGRAPTAPKLPNNFTLDPDARITVSHHAVWPEAAPKELSDSKPSPLEIHYLCIEEINTQKKAVGFYSRQAQVRLSDVRDTDKGAWIDSLRRDAQKDRRRSLDVLITRTDGKTGEDADENEDTDLVIEILSIEIKEPTKG